MMEHLESVPEIIATLMPLLRRVSTVTAEDLPSNETVQRLLTALDAAHLRLGTIFGNTSKERSILATLPLRSIVWQVARERAENCGLQVEQWLAEVVECYMVNHDYILLYVEKDALLGRRRKLERKQGQLQTQLDRLQDERVQKEREELRVEISRLTLSPPSKDREAKMGDLQGKLGRLQEEHLKRERVKLETEKKEVESELERLQGEHLDAEHARLQEEHAKLKKRGGHPAVTKQAGRAKAAMAARQQRRLQARGALNGDSE